MEYFRAVDEQPSANNTSATGSEETSLLDDSTGEDAQQEKMKVDFACERLILILSKVEGAYDAMLQMLPHNSHHPPDAASLDQSFHSQASLDSDDMSDYLEQPKVVPDLLPPCTSRNGDPTLEFFRACMNTKQSNGDDDDDDPSKLNDSSTIETDLDSHLVDGNSKLEDDTAKHGSHAHHGHAHGMFASFKKTMHKKGLGSVFGKKKKGKHDEDEIEEPEENENGEYVVTIEREMLGLTVENVLERTVVRTVLAGGPAKKAGAKVGSLIVKVGNIETKNLTHFETIDELRQSQRPLQLVLRQVSDEALRSAREEMGRLIRGSGFGKIVDGEPIPERVRKNDDDDDDEPGPARLLIGGDENIDIYSGIIRKRWIEAVNMMARTKKDEPVLRVGEKIIWILTLFIVGLEREASRLQSQASSGDHYLSSPRRHAHAQYQHTDKDYSDAAKSVSKVVSEFVKKKLDPESTKRNNAPQNGPGDFGGRQGPRGSPMMARGGRGGRGRGRGGMGTNFAQQSENEKLILQIGDILQRTRTFLADPTSPPAALLRGEVIACLCDILDADTDMELSEEENQASTQGGAKGGAMADLGSAGSLLKLIVLNCPIMRTPGCEEISLENALTGAELNRQGVDERELTADDYHRMHAGNRFLAVVHRLAASRSTSARITACSLGPVLWSHLDFPHQLQLRGVITRALHDVEVIVRKSTATVLHEIAELVYDPRCVPWLVLMCERAMTDPEPLLRSAAMTLTWHLAEHLPNAFLGDASKGSRYLRRLPNREDPIFADVYLLQCKLLPVATRLAEDSAPQVRLAVAAQCDRLCDSLGDHWSSVIIDVLVAMLSDSDERVRSEAVMCVPRLADIVLCSVPPGVIPAGEASVLDALIPASIKLQKDQSVGVRISLATAAGELLTILVGLQRLVPPPASESAEGKPAPSLSMRFEKRHVDERLIPLVQKLLHDANPEVTSSALRAMTNASRGTARDMRARLDTDDDSQSVVSMHSHASLEQSKPVFVAVLSEEQVLRLLPTLSELANSKQWRVRQSAVEIVPALLGCTSKFETRAEIAKLCVRLSKDKVDAVRKTAAECLCLGGGSLGSHGEAVSEEWIIALVIPQIQTCAKHSDYRQRLLCLKMVEVILVNGVCPAKWKDDSSNSGAKNTPLRELLKTTLSLATDSIPNVRLNVGRVLCGVIHLFDDEECRVVKYAIKKQLKEEEAREAGVDRDVIYFGNKCLLKVKQKLEHEHSQHDDHGSTTLV